jgi:hypothetical protein
MNRRTVERRADAIVAALRHGAGEATITTAFARISAEFGAEVEAAVVELVRFKILKTELPRRQRNTRRVHRA